ncbi:histidine kinase [Bifidobacterium santillanense]|uniref:histidine kinase n=1 Tax=Bifidobacterium santillanense TaxID=2809028 RepID=UPI001F0A8DF9|nr:histidine kinase [Bifidobacterium santillanense]
MRPIRSAVERAVGRFAVRFADRFAARFAHPAIATSCAVLAVAVVAEYAVSVAAHAPDVMTMRGCAMATAVLAGLIGGMFRPSWFLWAALVAGEASMLSAPMVAPLAVNIAVTGFLAYLDTWSGAIATGVLLVSSLFGFTSNEEQVMVTAVQSLTFYCFPLLTGLSLHMMRQRDHDAHLLRRQREREDMARDLHDTISNDLAYLILRIDRAEAQGEPADEHEYRRRLRDLRDAADRAMSHTHAVIDSLEDRGPGPSPFRPMRPESSAGTASIRPESSASWKSTPAPVLSEVPDGASVAAQRNDLRSLIDDEETRLDTLGFTGDTLLGELPHPLGDDTMRLLTGLLTELYANIAKHADPREWYALSIGFDANGIHVAVSDTTKPATGVADADNVGLGLGSGLDRYRALIEKAGGSLAVRSKQGRNWQLDAVIPTQIG